MSYCDNCILLDICGKEGCLDGAMTFCADKYEFIPKSVIEDIRREIEQIEINGFVDEKTMFTRTGTQVKTVVLDIIDNHISRKERINDTRNGKNISQTNSKLL